MRSSTSTSMMMIMRRSSMSTSLAKMSGNRSCQFGQKPRLRRVWSRALSILKTSFDAVTMIIMMLMLMRSVMMMMMMIMMAPETIIGCLSRFWQWSYLMSTLITSICLCGISDCDGPLWAETLWKWYTDQHFDNLVFPCNFAHLLWYTYCRRFDKRYDFAQIQAFD